MVNVTVEILGTSVIFNRVCEALCTLNNDCKVFESEIDRSTIIWFLLYILYLYKIIRRFMNALQYSTQRFEKIEMFTCTYLWQENVLNFDKGRYIQPWWSYSFQHVVLKHSSFTLMKNTSLTISSPFSVQIETELFSDFSRRQ